MRHHLQSLAPAALLILLVLFGGSVQAHPGHGGLAGFGSGALHPFTGVDHLLAMLGIGLWSALRGNGVSLRLPLWFVAGAALGTALGFAGLFDERIEIVLAASLIPLGVALLANLRGEHVLALCLVAVCGLLHGAAHGREFAGAHRSMAFAGFLTGTVVLHVAGAALALALPRSRRPIAIASSGAGLAAAGLWLLAA